jgi:hypothetical protein
MTTRAYKIYEILKSYAPDELARQQITKTYNTLLSERLPRREIELALIRAIYDGLQFRNWLWNQDSFSQKSTGIKG